VTFRCAKAVVEQAKELVPDYEAAPQNIEGEVVSINEAEFDYSVLQAGDAVICRNTKPLVTTAFSLIRSGIPCHVEGREIGAGLIALACRWKSIKSLAKLSERLQTYLERETEKLRKQEREVAIGILEDKVQTLQALIGFVGIDKDISDLKARIEEMFADTPEGFPPNRVTLLTAHRSKGLEYDNVYLLGVNKYMPSPFAKKPWQRQQEDNLIYVAITRAIKKLTFINVA
jgi:DNA helicase-2/ATP-dependent DNA helicase PcrA